MDVGWTCYFFFFTITLLVLKSSFEYIFMHIFIIHTTLLCTVFTEITIVTLLSHDSKYTLNSKESQTSVCNTYAVAAKFFLFLHNQQCVQVCICLVSL